MSDAACSRRSAVQELQTAVFYCSRKTEELRAKTIPQNQNDPLWYYCICLKGVLEILETIYYRC